MSEAGRNPRLPLDETREQLMVTVARMAWQQDASQLDIARETGLTRWQVARLLTEARELGIVRIEIVPRSTRQTGLEAELTRAFGLRDAVIVPDTGMADGRIEAVARAAAQFLVALAPRSIGVSWGRTMSAVAHWLPQNWARGVRVIGINGTVSLRTSEGARTNQVVESLAQKGPGEGLALPVPAVVGEALTRQVLERDRIVADVLAEARRAQALCFSFGAAGQGTVLASSGNISSTEMAGLVARGAVGDVLARFVGPDCRIVDPELDARTVGLEHDDLRRAPWSIGISTGPEKHAIARAALGAGLVNVLVTDSATAEHVLGTCGADVVR